MSRPADAASLLSYSTTTARSIYPRGPAFSLDTFASKDFIVRDFVEALSENATAGARRSGSQNQNFDPKPFIRTFEHALSRLDSLSEERQAHESDLSGAVRRAEAQHRQQCTSLQRKLDQALESFNGLENRMHSSMNIGNASEFGMGTGNVALQIGERLEELDRQKRRAEDAKALIQCWHEVSERGDLSYLEDIRRLGGGEGKVRCAQMARQLLKISHRLESTAPKTPQQTNGAKASNGDHVNGHNGHGAHRRREDTNELIEKFLESLEKDLLEQFDDFKRQHNAQGMRECATALFDFSDGTSVIARYVNQHELFLGRSHMGGDEISSDREAWQKLADPDEEPIGAEPSLQSLVEEVKLILQEESAVIKQVFPYHGQVLITFVQRVFQQSIQQRLEAVLDKANAISSLAFLRSLQAARSFIGATVEELKAHGLTEHPEAISMQNAACLDQQLEVLFVPFFAGSSYIDRERQSLEELYSSLLFKFTLYHSKKRKTSTSYLSALSQRGRELLSKTGERYIERLESSDLPASQKAILLRVSGIRDVDSKNKAEIEVDEEDGTLSLPVALRMLKWMAESVGRSLELSGGTETPKDVAILLRLLITNLADVYVDTALEAALEMATALENTRNEPELKYAADLKTAVRILQLIVTVSTSVLMPLAAPNVTIRRDMEKTVNGTVSRMEDRIGTVRARTIDVALSWVSKLLARQNRADFRPRDDGTGLEQLQTSTCSAIFSYLTKFRDQMSGAFEGQNAETFFTELAMGFRTLLLEHFKKFPVNLTGGLMVSKDITSYIELLRTFSLSQSFLPSLEVLVEVGNVFVIGPEALKERLRGGAALTGIDRADLRPYIMRREDANSVGVQAALNTL